MHPLSQQIPLAFLNHAPGDDNEHAPLLVFLLYNDPSSSAHLFVFFTKHAR
ncbi:hypothetical protein LDG_6993 [Legionella drancourtii LLAP12]|uniref:Uncharacterized protein n=1 Tax=Legionella drancourtii LLAP12 TaxID=658187 RepID=G9EP13_9GAMM|nr:hypothetical protein LDG_6993 [Legionella drancourtii LLAP12]